MDIGTAINMLRAKEYMRRPSWPGITYIFLEGYVIRRMHVGIESDWVPSHVDLLANDWEVTRPDR